MHGPGRTLVVLVAALGLTLAACSRDASMSVLSQKERGTAAELHENAPQKFKNIWERYQKTKNADPSGFGILALDRNLNGGGILYCWRYCNHVTPTAISQWRGEALQRCQREVRDNAPAEKPDCAVYAVGDKIVWTGPLPW